MGHKIRSLRTIKGGDAFSKAHTVLVALLICSFAWLSGPTQRAFGDTDQPLPIYGVSVHLWASSKKDVVTQLDRAADLRVRLIRWDVPWKAVEKSRGRLEIPKLWDFIVREGQKRHIESLMILDYGNPLYNSGHRPISPSDIQAYVRYTTFVVGHFKRRVKYFEIWNEWDQNNGDAGIGVPSEYMAVIKAAYGPIKAADPNAIVLVGGTSRYGMTSFAGEGGWDSEKYHFLERLIAMGITQYGDGLSIHPYTHTEVGISGKLASYKKMIFAIQRAVQMANGGQPFPLYITEVGWPSSGIPINRSVTLSDQAALVKATIEVNREIKGIRSVIFYELTDSGHNKSQLSDNFGLFDSLGNAKPAAAALKAYLGQ
jgi:hypothetical protein